MAYYLAFLSLVKLIYKIADQKQNYKVLDKADHEIVKQYLCAKKARKMLNWKPEYKLEQGLLKTINWYREFFKQ